MSGVSITERLFGRSEPEGREDACTDTTVSRKAVSLAQQGRFGEAIDCFDRVLKDDPANVKMWNNKGVFLDLLGRDQDALDCWGKALSIDPDFAPAWVSRGGMLHRRRNRLDEALACYDRAVELNPDSAVAWYNRSGVFVAMHRLDDAIACYERVLAIDPPHFVAAWADLATPTSSSTGMRRQSPATTAPLPTIPGVSGSGA